MHISAAQYAQAWFEALHSVAQPQWDTISERFLAHIHTQGNSKLLPDIVRLMEQYEEEARGEMAVTVRTAHALKPEMVQALVQQVLPEKSVRIRTQVEPSLIGGARIETRNSRWDASVLHQLNALAKTINE